MVFTICLRCSSVFGKMFCNFTQSTSIDLKWNRFFNNNGGKGRDILLDVKKEQQNHVLKTMWHAIGANLDEQNAQRTASSLESVQQINKTIDKDCDKDDKHTKREYHKQEEAVNQIISDLLEVAAFKNSPGRKGYELFPQFKSSLLEGLDYRNLHNWIKERIDLWGTIYQK